MENWAGNFEYQAARVHEPRDVEEVSGIVRDSEKVRVLGTRHSFNAIADAPGADLVSLKHLAGKPTLAGLDTPEPVVRVGGGMTYGRWCPWLDVEGWALHNLASLPDISVAGACATATHGSGDGLASLASAVVAMRIMDASGDVVEVSPATHGEWFAGAVVALGCLGPVVELTLKVEPSYEMSQHVYRDLPFEQLREHFDAITSAATSVSLFTDWRERRFTQVWLKQRTNASHPVPPMADFYGATPATQQMHPAPAFQGSAKNCTQQLGVSGPWHERLPHFRHGVTPSSGKELQSEYLVPRENALDAIEAVFELHKGITPHLYVSEIRTIAADDHWLSPCYQRDCIGIHFTWMPEREVVEALMRVIEARLVPMGARPHWAKRFTMPADAVRELYTERLEDFRTLAKRFDPAGNFRNPYVDEHIFGPA